MQYSFAESSQGSDLDKNIMGPEYKEKVVPTDHTVLLLSLTEKAEKQTR